MPGPRADDIPANALEHIAAQLSQRMAPARMPPGARAVLPRTHQAQLTESFAVWKLEPDALKRQSDKLSDLAVQTNRWHHQIQVAGQPEAFARSQPGPQPTDWELAEVCRSQLAGQLNNAITWIDTNVQGDPLVRLLVVPAYQVTAFWLTEGDKSQVLPVGVPPWMTNMPAMQLLDQRDFLTRLRAVPVPAGRTKSD